MSPPVALAAAALSLFIPVTDTKSKSKFNNKMTNNNSIQTFVFGVVVGISLGSYVAHEVRRYRVRERMRKSSQKWISSLISTDNDDNDEEGMNNEITHYVEPTHHEHIPSKEISATVAATRQVLVSPSDSSLTSTLHSVLLKLPPGTQMRPRESKCVELYFILKGNGYMHKNDKSYLMQPGHVLVIDPFTVRWMENKSPTDDFLFMRTMDASDNHADEMGFDVVAPGTVDPLSTLQTISSSVTRLKTSILQTTLFHSSKKLDEDEKDP